ncbi:MAG: arsenate-mycothiol transferase ArsC [Anaerolineae bacterium]
MPEVLFICTGNFYRSRFAEAVFNHEARLAGSRWRAFSRGLAIHLIEGDLSPYAAAALDERGITRDCTGPTRVALTAGDLERAGRVIALHESEHRPLIEEQFPHWANRITYWPVGDLDECEPAFALGEIARRVQALLADLDHTAAG